jgi:hypothetical protein
MLHTLNEPISITTTYNSKTNKVYPANILWKNRLYKVTKIGLHHAYRTGDILFHVFTVSTDDLSFKLKLNTTNLFWTLEQIADDFPG